MACTAGYFCSIKPHHNFLVMLKIFDLETCIVTVFTLLPRPPPPRSCGLLFSFLCFFMYMDGYPWILHGAVQKYCCCPSKGTWSPHISLQNTPSQGAWRSRLEQRSYCFWSQIRRMNQFINVCLWVWGSHKPVRLSSQNVHQRSS